MQFIYQICFKYSYFKYVNYVEEFTYQGSLVRTDIAPHQIKIGKSFLPENKEATCRGRMAKIILFCSTPLQTQFIFTFQRQLSGGFRQVFNFPMQFRRKNCFSVYVLNFSLSNQTTLCILRSYGITRNSSNFPVQVNKSSQKV